MLHLPKYFDHEMSFLNVPKSQFFLNEYFHKNLIMKEDNILELGMVFFFPC